MDARTEFKISQRSLKGGGEAGRAFDCILQPPKKKAKRKAKVAKKRQKTIPVPLLLPSPSPSPLSSPSPLLLLSPLPSPLPSAPVTPAEPISVDEVDKGEDENTKEPVEVEDEDVDSLPPPLPPPPARFISVWKAVISSKNKSLSGIKLAVFNTKNIYYFELDLWQDKVV